MDPVGITNLALLRIGAQAQVSSINPSDGSTEGDAASVLYQPTMDSLMRAAHWNFTRRQVAGTLVAASYNTPENASQTLPQPPQPWLYAYSVPADNLKIRYLQPVWDSFNGGGNPIPISTYGGTSPYLWLNPLTLGAVPWIEAIILDQNNNEIKVILTNLEDAQVIYTARVTNCDLWDVSFVEAASCALGAWFVNALARNAPLSAEMQRMAMGLITQARVRDGNEGVTTVDREADWMAVRGGMSSWAIGPYYNSYDQMGWPGGYWC